MLRGLSILLVILHHLALGFRLPLGPTPLGDLLGVRLVNTLSHSGYAAVWCFFVISGFLIARRVLQQHGGFAAIDARRFHFSCPAAPGSVPPLREDCAGWRGWTGSATSCT